MNKNSIKTNKLKKNKNNVETFLDLVEAVSIQEESLSEPPEFETIGTLIIYKDDLLEPLISSCSIPKEMNGAMKQKPSWRKMQTKRKNFSVPAS